jgi:hypothetical protein
MKIRVIQSIAALLALVALIAIISFAVSVRPEVSAQADSQALEERLIKLGIPVRNITITNKDPIQLEVFLLSSSTEEKTNNEDLWHRYLAERELNLAYLNVGLPVKSFRIVLQPENGKNLYDSTVFLYPDMPSQQLAKKPVSSLSNDQTKDAIEQNLDLYDLKLISLDVPSGYTEVTQEQMVSMELSTNTNSDTLNSPKLDEFIMNLRQQIEKINAQYGTSIVVVRAQIKDLEDKLLVDYMTDLEIGGQSSWVADGINANWFPRPAPVFTPEILPTTPTTATSPSPQPIATPTPPPEGAYPPPPLTPYP